MPRRFRVRPEPRQGRAVVVLVSLNVLVFLLWQVREPNVQRWMAAHFLVSLDHVLAGHVWTLLTSAFSQKDSMHLLFNMLALYTFGKDVEDVVGARRLVAIYVAGGIVASIGHLLWNALVMPGVPALGASGSVMAVSVLFGAFYPRRTLLLNFFIPVPAALAVAAYLALDVFGVLGAGTGNTAHAAHLGGAAVGFVYWLTIRRRISVGRGVRS